MKNDERIQCSLWGCVSPVRCVCLSLIILIGTVSTRAVTTEGNPYQAIVGRNVFSLKTPPPPPGPEDPLKKNPPPTIKLQGLTTILGRRQVLFKVLAKPPGQPKEESFIMTEGERQGEVEVLRIDEQAETVKFNNHGQEQLLNMKDDADKPVVAAPPPGLQPGALPGALPGVPPPTAFNPAGAGSVTTIGGIPQRTIRTQTPVGGAPVGANLAPQSTQVTAPLSRDEQELMIEVNRQRYMNDGNPHAKVLPPTSLSPLRNPPVPQ